MKNIPQANRIEEQHKKISIKFPYIVNDKIHDLIDISNPNVVNLIDPDEIVVPFSTIRVIYSFPLSVEKVVIISDSTYLTRKTLLTKVCENYSNIYKEEDAVSEPSPISVYSKMRMRTRGPYGIWGYWLSDLRLESIDQVTIDLFRLLVKVKE